MNIEKYVSEGHELITLAKDPFTTYTIEKDSNGFWLYIHDTLKNAKICLKNSDDYSELRQILELLVYSTYSITEYAAAEG